MTDMFNYPSKYLRSHNRAQQVVGAVKRACSRVVEAVNLGRTAAAEKGVPLRVLKRGYDNNSISFDKLEIVFTSPESSWSDTSPVLSLSPSMLRRIKTGVIPAA